MAVAMCQQNGLHEYKGQPLVLELTLGYVLVGLVNHSLQSL